MLVNAAISDNYKVYKPEVNTTSFLNRLFRNGLKLSKAIGVPVTLGGLLNGYALNFAMLMRVKAAYPAKLRKLNAVAFKFTAIWMSDSWQGSRLGFEFRKPGPFFKEVFKSPLNIFKCMLQAIRRSIIKPQISLLIRAHFSRLLIISKTFSRSPKRFNSSIKTPVKNVSDKATLIKQLLLLCSTKAQLYFNGFGIFGHAKLTLKAYLNYTLNPDNRASLALRFLLQMNQWVSTPCRSFL